MSTPAPPLTVLVDDRPATARAVAWAAREARLRRSAVRLVTTAGADPGPIEVARAHGRLARARRAALAADAVVTATAIVPERALRRGGDRPAALVVGTESTDDVGAVLAPLLDGARSPVVVVPAGWDQRRHDGEVIVAVDPADPDAVRRRVLAVGAGTAYRWERPLLVAVVAPPHREDVRAARRTFDAAADDVGPRVTVHEVLGHGDPAAELAALVGPSTGLLVLGGLGRTGRALLGGVRCPVVVVPEVAAAAAPSGTPAVVGGPG